MNTSTETFPTTATMTTHKTGRGKSVSEAPSNSIAEENRLKFPHSPILHYAFSSWIVKITTKTIHCHWETDLFNNSMGLCGNFTRKQLLLPRGSHIQRFRRCRSTTLRLSILLALFSKLQHLPPQPRRIYTSSTAWPRSSSALRRSCFACGKFGHFGSQCPFRGVQPSASQPSERI